MFGLSAVLLGIVVASAAFYALFIRPSRAPSDLDRMQRPCTPIAELRDGAVVKIVGTIQLLETPLLSPLTGERCVAFDVEFRRQEASPAGSSWTMVGHQREAVDFLVADETGEILVHGKSVELVPSPEVSFSVLPEDPASATGDGAGNRPQQESPSRGHEELLVEGQRVAVFGKVHQEIDPNPKVTTGYRDAPMRWVLGPSNNRGVLASTWKSALRR